MYQGLYEERGNEKSCSICEKDFSENRLKVRLCSNFHFSCYPCLEEIAKVKPACPSCREKIKKFQIQKEQCIRKSLCPFNHFTQKLKYQKSYCNQCGLNQDITMLCQTCNYRVCSKCHYKYHQDSCKQTEREYFSNLQFEGKCGKCGELQKRVGMRCARCKVLYCSRCMKRQKRHLVVTPPKKSQQTK